MSPGANQSRRAARYAGSGDDRGKYVEVRDRVLEFYVTHPDGRIVTEVDYALTQIQPIEVHPVTKQKDGGPVTQLVPSMVGVIAVKASAYRKQEDTQPAGTGHSWMMMPGQTPYTVTSELENAETSAVGRALANMGIKITEGMASANEIRNARQQPDPDDLAAQAWEEAQRAGTGEAPAADTPTDATPAVPGDGGTVLGLPEQAAAVFAGQVDGVMEKEGDGTISAMDTRMFAKMVVAAQIPTGAVNLQRRAMFPEVEKVADLTDHQRALLWYRVTAGAGRETQDA